METTSFLVWLVFIAVILSVGLGVMLRAYKGSGGFAVRFAEPIIPPDNSLDGDTALQFQKGCDAYRSGKFRRASDQFTRLIQLQPALA